MSSVLTTKGIAVMLIALVIGIGVGGLVIAPIVTAGTTSQQNLILAYELGGYQWGGSIYITGSTTVFPITVNEIPAFEAAYPTISVSTLGVGSGAGYAAVDSGSQPIAAVSRMPTSTENTTALANGVHMVGWTIGADAICIIYNPPTGLPLPLNLTASQVRDIFQGVANKTYTSWNQINSTWPTATITVYSRESGSGTRGDFESAFGVSDSIMNGAPVASSNGQMVSDVQGNAGSLGYCGFAYFTPSGLPAANIAYNSTYNYYPPSISNIRSWALYQLNISSDGVQNNTVQYSGQGYFACRFLYYVTNGIPSCGSLIDRWLRYALSPAGQAMVDSTGYVSMQTIGYLWPAQLWN
jgi:phosphate transport system substrate-binding protein